MYRKQLITQIGNFVHLNLCLALTFGLVIFLVGSEGATSSPVSCESLVCCSYLMLLFIDKQFLYIYDRTDSMLTVIFTIQSYIKYYHIHIQYIVI